MEQEPMERILQYGPNYISNEEACNCLDIRLERNDWNISRGKDWIGPEVGEGPANWKTERRNKYAAIGPQNKGTTYHTVRVNICRKVGMVLASKTRYLNYLEKVWAEQTCWLWKMARLMHLFEIVWFTTLHVSRCQDTELARAPEVRLPDLSQ